MHCITRDNIHWLEFKCLQMAKEIIHGILLRDLTGHLQLEGSLSAQTDEHVEAVAQNWQKVCAAMQLPKVVCCRQVHGNNVAIIDRNNCDDTFECDALITAASNVALAIRVADCQAAIFYDQAKKVIACAHAGWKGLVNNIYKNVVDCMQHNFDCNLADISVYISPSLHQDHAEFKSWEIDLGIAYRCFVNDKLHVDYIQIAIEQLAKLGIDCRNIHNAEFCTYCHPRDFFSYRRSTHDGSCCGRNAAVVMLK